MFDIFQPRKNATLEDSRSDEASARDDLAKALVEAAPQAETNQKTQPPGNRHTASAVGGEAKPLRTPNPDSKINQVRRRQALLDRLAEQDLPGSVLSPPSTS